MNREKTEKLIEKIMENVGWTYTSKIEWFDNDTQKEMGDIWCRFLASGLGSEELEGLLKYFDVHISSFDINSVDKDSELLELYKELIEEEDIIMFQIQLSDKL